MLGDKYELRYDFVNKFIEIMFLFGDARLDSYDQNVIFSGKEQKRSGYDLISKKEDFKKFKSLLTFSVLKAHGKNLFEKKYQF